MREEVRGSRQLDLGLLRSPRDQIQKKFLHAAEQDRPDVAAARQRLRAEQPTLKPKRLVFIEETSVTTKMTRL